MEREGASQGLEPGSGGAATAAPARPAGPRFFTGSFEHSVDDKNRLVLPATYRPRLAGGAYLGPLDGCLGLWPEDGFAAVLDKWEDGIGLGLVKTLVGMHRGSITAHSEGPGRGSEFVVRLPVLPAAPPEPTPPWGDERGTKAALPRRRILVVDDNVDAAVSLARLLARLYGQEVRVAHDGPSALAVAEEFRPEIVVLDIGLPGMDGHEIARAIRADPELRSTHLVALSGFAAPDDLAAAKAAGFDRHLAKPPALEHVLEILMTAPGPEAPGT